MYPYVPNTTHLTQEANQSYSEFKTKGGKNLHQLTIDRQRKGKSVAFKQVSLVFWYLVTMIQKQKQ